MLAACLEPRIDDVGVGLIAMPDEIVYQRIRLGVVGDGRQFLLQLLQLGRLLRFNYQFRYERDLHR